MSGLGRLTRLKKRSRESSPVEGPPGEQVLTEQVTQEMEKQVEAPRVFASEESVAVAYKTRRRRKVALSGFWEAINSNNTFLIFVIVVGLLCVIAVGTYIFEEGVNDAIKSLWDTLWYTIVTLTTVGYGDKYPVTVGGKILGIFMMVLGVASVGIVTGRIASFLVDKQIKARGGMIVLEKKKGHFVICGWKPELESIIDKILAIDPGLKPSDLVLVNDADPQEIDHIRTIPRFKTVKYIKGDYIDEKVLQRANIRSAGKVLILADSSKDFSLQEVDSRTVMTAISVNNMNKNVYMCAELIEEKFVKYLKVANCDEIILTREYSRELLANAASASGISHIAAELLNPVKRGLVTVNFKSSFVGKPFRDLQEYYKSSTGDIVIGLLENTGNIYHRKKEALADAQKTPDISKLVENLQSVKRLFPNNPVLNPGDDYIIKHNSKAIIVTCNADARE